MICLFLSQKIVSMTFHPHVVMVARISLTLSRHFSLSFIASGRSSSSHSCWMYVRAGRPTFARPCVGVHKSTSLMSSSLLLQQCPAWPLLTIIPRTFSLSQCFFSMKCLFDLTRNKSMFNAFLNIRIKYLYVYTACILQHISHGLHFSATEN